MTHTIEDIDDWEMAAPAEFKPQDVSRRVRDVPRGIFRYFYNPGDWQLDGRGELRPSIGHIGMWPGCAAVDPTGDPTVYVQQLQRNGFVELPSTLPDGTPLVVAYLNTHGRKVHRSAFMAPYRTPTGHTAWNIDDEAGRDWVDWLRETGVIPPPSPGVIRQHLAAVDRVLDRLAALAERPGQTPETDARRSVKLDRFRNARAALLRLLPESEQHHGHTLASPVRGKLAALRRGEGVETARPAPTPPRPPAAGKAARKVRESL